MNKSILWFLTVVIVLARCSAESIPATSETSGFAGPHSTQAHAHDKHNFREAPHEEREVFPIESFVSSVKAADESRPGTKHALNMVDVPELQESNKALVIHEANMMDVSDIKELNKVLATRMETLGIDIGGIVLVTKALKPGFPHFSFNNLEWMILGKVFFGRDGSSTDYKVLSSKQMFKELNMKITNNVEITKWSTKLSNFNVRIKVVFGKMLWLLQHRNELNLHPADAAKMAFGSEYLEVRKLPTAKEILQAVGEENVDRDLVESIVRQDKDSTKRKTGNADRGPFVIESFTLSLKTADESLPRTKHADSMMDVSEITERNEVLATRMDKLGIDIGGVIFVTKALKSAFPGFSLNNLGWMILGKAYFEKVGSITDDSSLHSKELFEKLNMEIINYEEIKKWALRVNGFQVGARKVFGKMLWLLQEQKDLNLDVADAAKMAFGSEFFLKKRKLPFSDEIFKAVSKQNVDKDVTESLIRQDKDSTMTDIAGDKQKATRKYVGEGLHEQSNKNRKLA